MLGDERGGAQYAFPGKVDRKLNRSAEEISVRGADPGPDELQVLSAILEGLLRLST